MKTAGKHEMAQKQAKVNRNTNTGTDQIVNILMIDLTTWSTRTFPIFFMIGIDMTC